MRTQGIDFLEATSEGVKVYVYDHDTFSVVKICVDSTELNFYLKSSAEASAFCEALTSLTRVNYRTAQTV